METLSLVEEIERYSWRLQSKCQIYSRSKDTWSDASITDIYIDASTNTEWFTVKYGDNKTKNIQRLCKDIKPMKSIFNSAQNAVDTEDEENDFKNCEKLNRLFATLKYYSYINDETTERFHQFIMDTYKDILNDVNHLITNYDQQLQEINEYITVQSKLFDDCDMSQCQFTSRHHRGIISTKNMDSRWKFYKETLDSVHFYLFHCFHSGLRILKNTEIENKTRDQNKSDDEYFDAQFNRITNTINEARMRTDTFDRFQNDNNKFTILSDDTQKNKQKSTINVSFTFLDEMYKYMNLNKVKEELTTKLTEFIDSEEFDTDALEIDVNLDKGNINIHIDNEKALKAMKDFIRATHINSASFSIGFRFYYWDYYKDAYENNIGDGQGSEYFWNVNDHSGYKVKELYIEQKYDSFKEEISNYKYIDMQQYEDIVMIKAEQYINTDIVKQTKSHWGDGGVSYPESGGTSREIGAALYYGIKHKESLKIENLVALILYTDFTELSCDFTSTFRKVRPFEMIQSVKDRNREYWWWSKILRETVEYFGGCGSDKTLIGPFYTGMSIMMNIPQLKIRLCSPTSTSKHIAVAIRFSGENGIILQFNNKKEGYGLRGFDCSWISKYKEEDERLFFGGYRRVKLESVRIRKTGRNYEKIMHSLFLLDVLITGGQIGGWHTFDETDGVIIASFMNYMLGKKQEHEYDEYVYRMFECFALNKRELTLDINKLRKSRGFRGDDIVNLIMSPIESTTSDKSYINWDDDENETNMFKADVLNVFKNVETIFIQTARIDNMCPYEYSFSLSRLLSMIERRNIIKNIKIEGDVPNNRYGDKYIWIGYHWNSAKLQIINKFKKSNFEIKCYPGIREQRFSIKRDNE